MPAHAFFPATIAPSIIDRKTTFLQPRLSSLLFEHHPLANPFRCPSQAQVSPFNVFPPLCPWSRGFVPPSSSNCLRPSIKTVDCEPAQRRNGLPLPLGCSILVSAPTPPLSKLQAPSPLSNNKPPPHPSPLAIGSFFLCVCASRVCLSVCVSCVVLCVCVLCECFVFCCVVLCCVVLFCVALCFVCVRSLPLSYCARWGRGVRKRTRLSAAHFRGARRSPEERACTGGGDGAQHCQKYTQVPPPLLPVHISAFAGPRKRARGGVKYT